MNAPAGWYDDRQDATLIRYWDGAQWTSHTAPKPVQMPPPVQSGPAVPPQSVPMPAPSPTLPNTARAKPRYSLDAAFFKALVSEGLRSKAVWILVPIAVFWIYLMNKFYSNNVDAGFSGSDAFSRSLTPATFITALVIGLLFAVFYGGRFAGFVHRAGKDAGNFSLYDQSCSDLMGLKDGVDFTMKTHIAQIVYNRSRKSHCSVCTSKSVRNWAFDWTTKG